MPPEQNQREAGPREIQANGSVGELG